MDDWKNELDAYFKEQKATKKEIKMKKEGMKKTIKHFMQGEVIPAFNALRKEFKKHKREIEVDSKKDWAAVLVKKNKHKEFVYEVNISTDNGKLIASKSVYTANKKGKLKLRAEGKIHNQKNSLLLTSVKKEHIIKDFLENYKDSTRVK
jgi:hypothetical protein